MFFNNSSASMRAATVNRNFLFAVISRSVIPILLLIFIGLAVVGLEEKSATFDEPNHLVRGLYPLAGKGYLLNREHPPLINLLQALPVHFSEHPQIPPATPQMHPFFFHSERVLWSGGNDGKQMILEARKVTVGLAVVLGFLIYLWATKLHGEKGGLAALGLFVFSPLMLAHGRLVTTDMGLALFLFAFFFSLWSLILRPSPKRLLIAGFCLGAAVASKHLALLALVGSLLTLVAAELAGRTALAGAFQRTIPPWSHRLLSPLLVWLSLVLMAFVVVWGLYGFQVGELNGLGIVVPAPDYFGGLYQGWQSVQSGRIFYLNGRISDQGWISYFPLAFLYKTPLPVLAWLIITIALHLCGKFRVGNMMGFLAIPVCLMTLGILLEKVNLGLRHLLWVYPFLFLYLSAVVQVSKWRWASLPLLGWLAFATLGAQPHYLSYFNRTIPQLEKHLYLVDSNLDWGQDLPALARYQKENSINRLQLGYFGTADPKAYGVIAEPLVSFMRSDRGSNSVLDREGVIAVSATLLQGLYNRPQNFYVRFREITPTAQIGGGSILIFDCRKETGGCKNLPE